MPKIGSQDRSNEIGNITEVILSFGNGTTRIHLGNLWHEDN